MTRPIDQVLKKIISNIASYSPDKSLRQYINSSDRPNASDLLDMENQDLYREAGKHIHSNWPRIAHQYDLKNITNQDEVVVGEIIAAILEGFSGGKDQLTKSLFLVTCLNGNAQNLANLIMPLAGLQKPIGDWICELVKNIKIELGNRSNRVPMWENEAVSEFEQATLKRDFTSIMDFMNGSGRSLNCPFLPKIIAKLAFLYNPNEMTRVMEDKLEKSFFFVYSFIEFLSRSEAFKMLSLTTDNLLRMTLFERISKNKKEDLSSREISLLAKELYKNQLSLCDWKEFSAFFGRYPVRYPSLWSAVGISLQESSKDVIEVLINNFDEGRHNPNISEFTDIFEELNGSRSFSIFLSLSFESWSHYHKKRRQNKEDICRAIEYSSFINAVVNHFFLNHSLSAIKSAVKKILSIAKEPKNKWFVNQSLSTSYYGLLASYLDPLFRAYHLHTRKSADLNFENEVINEVEYIYGFKAIQILSFGPDFIKETKKLMHQ